MKAYRDWRNLLVRWVHVIAGVAWIGASFYFVMLDNSLSVPKKEADKRRGVSGELWAVHGGGFFKSEKFLTGPEREPFSNNLLWSKWEAYTAWLSGTGLMALSYWYGASTYLIDRSVLDLSPASTIAISVAFLADGWLGWLTYDGLCRSLVGQEDALAALILADDVGKHAVKIAETVGIRYLPLANLMQMTDEERAVIATCFAQGAKR
ncbi:MAG: urate hydroxylase PuuD [Casimicrobiaceae bacterium]